MNQAAEMKTLRRKIADKEPSISALGRFDPDDFDVHEDAFLNLLAQSFGVLHEPLRYVVRPAMTPTEFPNNEEERMYHFPLSGRSFELDNQAGYRKLKAFLIDSPGWAWIERHDATEDGHTAYMADAARATLQVFAAREVDDNESHRLDYLHTPRRTNKIIR